jgi:hypothetical protein
MADLFKVVYLKSVREKTQASYRRFRRKGLQRSFVTAAATIDKELRSDPRGFGDPCYSIPDLELDIFVRAVHPLLVYYGVHQTEPVVFVNFLETLDK